MIMYWAKILMGIDNKLTSVIYRYFYKCYTDGSFLHPLGQSSMGIGYVFSMVVGIIREWFKLVPF